MIYFFVRKKNKKFWLLFAIIQSKYNTYNCVLIIYSKETNTIYRTDAYTYSRKKYAIWSGLKDSWYNNLLGVSQAYKAGFGCITFPWCPFHCGITWPVTPELVAFTVWNEIAHWTEGVYRSLAFSIHSQPPHVLQKLNERYRGSLQDEESGTGRAEGGNSTNSNFLRKITVKWKNNGSGIIGLLAWSY